MQVIQVNTSNQTTVLEALKSSHDVKTAFVCASPNDIECVDGVCNNRVLGRYWTIEVNEEYQSVNSESLVGPSDKVVLKYASLKGK